MIIRRLGLGEEMLYRGVRLASLAESPDAFSSSYAEAMERDESSWHVQADASATGGDRATFIAIDGEAGGVGAIYGVEGEREVGELIQMWIAPERRGQDLAGNLLDGLLRWAWLSGFRRIKAEVEISNARALRFYQSYGFAKSAEAGSYSKSSLVLTIAVDSVVSQES